MPDPLPLPNQPPSTFALGNIGGSPLTTVGGALIGAGQYLTTNGLVLPHDKQTWIQFVLGLLFAIGGALLRGPQGKAA